MPVGTPGGRAIKFYSDMRIEVKSRQVYREGSGDTREDIGHKLRIRIVKNKVGTKGGYALIDFYYDQGFDTKSALLEAGVAEKAIERGGAWYTYEPLNTDLPTIKEQGKEAFFESLEESEYAEELLDDLKTKIIGDDIVEVSGKAG